MRLLSQDESMQRTGIPCNRKFLHFFFPLQKRLGSGGRNMRLFDVHSMKEKKKKKKRNKMALTAYE